MNKNNNKMNEQLYKYRFELIRVLDGDTIKVAVDLGFNTWVTKTIRLAGIDAPSRSIDASIRLLAQTATNILRKRLVVDCLLEKSKWLKTYKDKMGKYGRVIADVFIKKENINDWLVNKKLCLPYDGGSKSELKELHRENAQYWVNRRSQQND